MEVFDALTPGLAIRVALSQTLNDAFIVMLLNAQR